MCDYFIDTSALFKRYIPEEGTGELDVIFKNAKTFYISDITIIEVLSNLKRKNEIFKEISKEVYKNIKSEFLRDIADGNIRTTAVVSATIIEAINLIDKRYVTPLNSLQLATALQLNSEKGSIIFICSDKKLFILAEKCGLKSLLI